MARRKETNPGEKKIWEEAELSAMTDEQILEIVTTGGYGFTFSGDPTKEDYIEVILKAQEDSQDDNDPPPDQGNPPGETIRVRNKALIGGKVYLANGKLAEFDKDGIAEIETAQAQRLLTIPGYEKA